MNYKQNKGKAKCPNIHVDIKNSRFNNEKHYYFLVFKFFGSKFQHFSTFGLNQDDHDLTCLQPQKLLKLGGTLFIKDKIGTGF